MSRQLEGNLGRASGTSRATEFNGSLQSILSAIAQPVSVKPGGYHEDIFLDLTAEERQQYECSICFLVVKDPRECPNRHMFCANCILTWSMSLASECRLKCPVCRTDGRYRPSPDKEKVLSKKHVKCPEEGCSWAGVLQDYKWHARKHERTLDNKRTLPPLMRMRGGQSTRSSSGLNESLERFAQRLDTRRRSIQQHFVQQEEDRLTSLTEVEDLSRRLSHVAQDIVHLLDGMQTDSRRFQRYVQETEAILPSVSPRNSPRNLPINNGASAERVTYLPLEETRSAEDDLRLERILADGSSHRNPFVVDDDSIVLRLPPRTSYIPLPPGHTPSEADARVQRLLSERTSTHNPYTLPDNLPILRPPPRSINSSIFPPSNNGHSSGNGR